MNKNLSKPVLLASLLAFALVDNAPSLRAQDPPASAPQPSGGGPTPPAIAGGDSSAAGSKPPAKKKKRKRTRKKKAPVNAGAAPGPGDGAAQSPSGDLSSGTTPAK